MERFWPTSTTKCITFGNSHDNENFEEEVNKFLAECAKKNSHIVSITQSSNKYTTHLTIIYVE